MQQDGQHIVDGVLQSYASPVVSVAQVTLFWQLDDQTLQLVYGACDFATAWRVGVNLEQLLDCVEHVALETHLYL